MPAARVLPAVPLDARRVVTQPGVARAGRRDRRLECEAGGRRVLVERDPHPTLGDEQVRHRARPVAGLHRARRRSHTDPAGRTADPPSHSANARAPASATSSGTNASTALTPVMPDRAVGGAPVDPQPERQRASVGDHHPAARRLGEHGGVADVAAAQGRERAQPAVLLAHHAVHSQRPPQPDTGPRDRREPPACSPRRRPSCRTPRDRAACRRRSAHPTGRRRATSRGRQAARHRRGPGARARAVLHRADVPTTP